MKRSKCPSKHFHSGDNFGLRERNWSWDLIADQWDHGFEQLKKYTNKTGAARPPQRLKTADGFALGYWVGTQRKNKAELAAERHRLLERLTGWSWDPIADDWNKAFEQLKAYTKKAGTARPLQRLKSPDGFALGAWVNNQRNNKSELSAERKRLLQSLDGWSWGTKKNPKSKQK